MPATIAQSLDRGLTPSDKQRLIASPTEHRNSCDDRAATGKGSDPLRQTAANYKGSAARRRKAANVAAESNFPARARDTIVSRPSTPTTPGSRRRDSSRSRSPSATISCASVGESAPIQDGSPQRLGFALPFLVPRARDFLCCQW